MRWCFDIRPRDFESIGQLRMKLMRSGNDDTTGEISDEAAPDDPAAPLRIAIVGRPNAGKSTLINRLIGADRLLTGPEAGITRDSIAVDWEWQGRRLRLFGRCFRVHEDRRPQTLRGRQGVTGREPNRVHPGL